MTPHETVGDFADERSPGQSEQRGSWPRAEAATSLAQEAPPRARPRAPRAIRVYQRWRAAVGVLVVGLLFAGGWLLNGYFTAQVVAAAWGDWWLGWAVHLIITAIELTTTLTGPVLRRIRAPAWVHALLWAVVLPFGLVDTGSSALGLMQWALMLGLPVGLPLSAGVTLAAELIAFVPEPMLVWLVLAFRQVVSE
jgi:hypothetical protein